MAAFRKSGASAANNPAEDRDITPIARRGGVADAPNH
jgi:hypothetical protein